MPSPLPAFEATLAKIRIKYRNILIFTLPLFGGSLTFSFLYPVAIVIAVVDSEETEQAHKETTASRSPTEEKRKGTPESQKIRVERVNFRILELGVQAWGRFRESDAIYIVVEEF